MYPVQKQAAQYAASLLAHMEAEGKTQVTMTEATTMIFGTSGTGSPQAKNIIENGHAYGYLTTKRVGKVKRIVSKGKTPIPAEIYASESHADKVAEVKRHNQSMLDMITEQTITRIEQASTPEARKAAFYSGIRNLLKP